VRDGDTHPHLLVKRYIMNPKLLIKFPTRNRPEKFKECFTEYINKLSGKHDVRFVITMDSDDPTMNNDEIRDWLKSLVSKHNIIWHYGGQ